MPPPQELPPSIIKMVKGLVAHKDRPDNVEEAAIATRKLQELMSKYSFQLWDIELTEMGSTQVVRRDFLDQHLKPHQLDILKACCLNYYSDMMVMDGTTPILFGSQHNIYAAWETYKYLDRETNRLCERSLQNFQENTRHMPEDDPLAEKMRQYATKPAEFRHSFLQGAGHAISWKMKQIRNARNNSQTAMVVRHKEDIEEMMGGGDFAIKDQDRIELIYNMGRLNALAIGLENELGHGTEATEPPAS